MKCPKRSRMPFSRNFQARRSSSTRIPRGCRSGGVISHDDSSMAGVGARSWHVCNSAFNEGERTMTPKRILVLVDGGPLSEATLETGIAAAAQFDAEVQALHVQADPATLVPIVGEGMSGALVAQ